MAWFLASNKVQIRFVCRDAPDNHYEFCQRGEQPKRLQTINDEPGTLRLHHAFNGPVTPDLQDAFAEFKANEAAEYAAWRKKNKDWFLPDE